MEDYGLRVHPHGVTLHSDRRMRRLDAHTGEIRAIPLPGGGGRRRSIKRFSVVSQRRLGFVAANVGGRFRSHLTLTYHAMAGEDESDWKRNERIASRAKRDLNRFLSALRRSLGEYLWVMEFQGRGVVHFHVLCEREIDQERAALAWLRATDELDDADAMLHAARVDAIRSERGARHYVGRYLGKIRQKSLPPGVERAGRWWGRSRGLEVVVQDEVISCEWACDVPSPEGVRIVRGAVRWLRRFLGWKFRGGSFVSWGDELATRLRVVVGELRGFYGTPRRWAEVLAGLEGQTGGEVGRAGGQETAGRSSAEP